MLYKKKNEPFLTEELFQSPTSEFRGAPFWAWNCKLDLDELKSQVEILKKMGFGGGHMHVRTGMATPYLSDEYMGLIKGVVEKAKEEGMYAYLYDEDRWPSGAAGGLVTKDKQYRGRYLLFTPTPYGEGVLDLYAGSTASGGRNEKGRLISCYDVQLDENGLLVSYKQIGEDEKAIGHKWYAYLELLDEAGWYNNQTYVNTLDKKAMDRFIEITYEAYNRTIPEEFDETVPSIFTDEPQFTRKQTLQYATDLKDVALPWTDDLPDTFKESYGEDLLASLPELFWDKPGNEVSVIRYHYHDHVCERFTNSFADNCGKWCREHNLKLTGHMMEEPTLESQTAALGEAMRAYRGFDLPGIDMLCARMEYTTAKQTQSAVHQFGYEGMTSELYGVTNWDFDFRGHKLHGDWQAALGVTLRVPHLSWVSMAGEAKRDYPASISYQSPWWEKYKLIEDHFARVNTALTRGKPLVKVGVIHPIESYWLHWGPAESTSLVRDELDKNFQELTKWLLFGSIDFDFISESLFPEQCKEVGNPLAVGKMNYDVILVPGLETIRSTTLDRLEAFEKAGGKVIFAGDLPRFTDAVPSNRGKELAAKCERISLSRGAVINALNPYRLIEIRYESGALTDDLLYQYRQDNNCNWLFIAHGDLPRNNDTPWMHVLRIRVKGNFDVKLYNTLTGAIEDVDYEIGNGYTTIYTKSYEYDSFLYQLTETDVLAKDAVKHPDLKAIGVSETNKFFNLSNAFNMDENASICDCNEFAYTLSEPNALLLDKAEWALDDMPFQKEEEILRLDNKMRALLDYPSRAESLAQPWVVPDEKPVHTAHIRLHVHTAIPVSGASLAIEDAEKLQISVNGKVISNEITGYYVDKSIKTVSLPDLNIGDNIITVDIPFSKRANIEWCYVIGQFGVSVKGHETTIIEMPKTISFGNFTNQGFPFYGGNITYHMAVETTGKELCIRSSMFRGVLQTVTLDDGAEEPIFYPPYTVSFGKVAAGKHDLHVTLYGHRRNSFGAVHLTDRAYKWFGPPAWRSQGSRFSYDYQICEEGILTTPTIFEQ